MRHFAGSNKCAGAGAHFSELAATVNLVYTCSETLFNFPFFPTTGINGKKVVSRRLLFLECRPVFIMLL